MATHLLLRVRIGDLHRHRSLAELLVCFDYVVLSVCTCRYSMLGRVEDPASELSNGDVYMTNSKRDSTRNQTSSQNDDQRRYMLNVKYLMTN